CPRVCGMVDPEPRARGQSSFVIPPGTKGLSQGQKYKKHGIRASHTAEVILDDVRVPGRCLLGGKEKLDAKLAQARAIARAAYEFALDYAKERRAFGRPIIMNQGIAFKLADMAMEIDAARL